MIYPIRIGHEIVSSLGLLPANAVVKILVWRFWPVLTFLWRIYLCMALLRHRVHTIYSTLLDNAKLYFKLIVPTGSPMGSE